VPLASCNELPIEDKLRSLYPNSDTWRLHCRIEAGRIMKKHGMLSYFVLAGFILSLAGILLAQTPPDRTLYVNGKPTGTVTQVGGHSYIDIDTLAQITNGTVTIEPNRVLLNIPTREPNPNSNAAPPSPSETLALSREFARAAIAELSEMREWRGAVGTILTFGVPVVGTWPQDYHDRVQTDLAQVALAATTAGDHDALELLNNQFRNLEQWANDIVSARQSMNATKTVDPNYMQNDPLLAKISSCSNFLSSMLVSGVYSDKSSCH